MTNGILTMTYSIRRSNTIISQTYLVIPLKNVLQTHIPGILERLRNKTVHSSRLGANRPGMVGTGSALLLDTRPIFWGIQHSRCPQLSFSIVLVILIYPIKDKICQTLRYKLQNNCPERAASIKNFFVSQQTEHPEIANDFSQQIRIKVTMMAWKK